MSPACKFTADSCCGTVDGVRAMMCVLCVVIESRYLATACREALIAWWICSTRAGFRSCSKLATHLSTLYVLCVLHARGGQRAAYFCTVFANRVLDLAGNNLPCTDFATIIAVLPATLTYARALVNPC